MIDEIAARGAQHAAAARTRDRALDVDRDAARHHRRLDARETQGHADRPGLPGVLLDARLLARDDLHRGLRGQPGVAAGRPQGDTRRRRGRVRPHAGRGNAHDPADAHARARRDRPVRVHLARRRGRRDGRRSRAHRTRDRSAPAGRAPAAHRAERAPADRDADRAQPRLHARRRHHGRGAVLMARDRPADAAGDREQGLPDAAGHLSRHLAARDRRQPRRPISSTAGSTRGCAPNERRQPRRGRGHAAHPRGRRRHDRRRAARVQRAHAHATRAGRPRPAAGVRDHGGVRAAARAAGPERAELVLDERRAEPRVALERAPARHRRVRARRALRAALRSAHLALGRARSGAHLDHPRGDHRHRRRLLRRLGRPHRSWRSTTGCS